MAEDHALVLGSEPSDTEVLSTKKRERVSKIKRITAFAAFGLAMLAAIAYQTSHTATKSLRSSEDFGQTVELKEEVSTYFLIKHSFKEDKDVGTFWKNVKHLLSEPALFKKATDGWHDAGFHNSFFLPTAPEGPIYCVWEAKAGKTKEDMQKFIDGPISPVGLLHNDVMPYDAKLTGGAGPTESFFDKDAPHQMRRLEGGEAEARALEETNTYFLIKHEFKDNVKEWWGKLSKITADPKKYAAWKKATEADGFHGIWMFPTAYEGPIYCFWESKGKTKEEMEEFINTNKNSPATTLKNTVMPVPGKLLGGPAGMTVDETPNSYFKFD